MLKNLSPRFIEELGSPNPQPFAILEIQSRGVADEATSQADWETTGKQIAGGSSNVDYNQAGISDPPPQDGDVILAATANEQDQGPVYPTDETSSTEVTGTWSDVDAPESDANFLSAGIGTNAEWYGPQSLLSSLDANITIKSVSILTRATKTGASAASSYQPILRIGDVNYPGAEHILGTSYADFTREFTVNPATSDNWRPGDIATITDIGVTNWDRAIECRISVLKMIVTYFDFETSGFITVQLDLTGANTANKATISISDLVPTGSGLSVTAEGSTTGAWGGEEVALGAVEDGSQVDGYEHYQLTSSFTGDGATTSVLKSISVEIPDRIYRFTSRSGGIFGALPYLTGIPGRSIAIDLKDFVTLGSDLKAGLQKDESVVQMIRENYFKNLNSSVRIGLYRDDITEDDLAFTFQGKVDGYRPGMEEVSISLKDGTKDLSAKWPPGIAITKDGDHMVDVINTVMDDVGIAARFINRGSLDTLKSTVGDGSPASTNYVVYRGGSPPVASGDTTITEPETAKKVVGELLELLGAYMVSQEDGKITVVEYDSSKASVGDTWTRDDFLEEPIYNPDVENIINDTFVYIDWNGEWTDADDF